jgi:hypothetical protein
MMVVKGRLFKIGHQAYYAIWVRNKIVQAVAPPLDKAYRQGLARYEAIN